MKPIEAGDTIIEMRAKEGVTNAKDLIQYLVGKVQRVSDSIAIVDIGGETKHFQLEDLLATARPGVWRA